MKKKLFKSLFFLWVTPFISSSAPANTFQICSSCEITSLREAIQKAQSGDTLEVQKGTYKEGMVVIDKPLHVLGIDHPIIDGLNQEHVFKIKADGVTLEGLVIQNSGVSTVSEFAGIRIEDSKRCKFLNNILQNNTYSFYLAKIEDCLIQGNTITGNAKSEVFGGNGIHLWNSHALTLRDNKIQHHRDGIYLEFTTDSLIEGNWSAYNLRYGLHFMYSHRNRYFKNSFIQNQTGVAVMYSRHIEMRVNHFEKSWGPSSYGLLLKDISDSVIEGNMISENTVGIFADGVSRDEFLHNNFKNNGWALRLLGNSENNIFRENNFVSNYFNVATNSRENSNLFEQNYWSDYRGYDLNHDGMGDVPFRPMKIFSLWVSQYPELVILLQSPVIEFLEVAERIFPILTPKSMQDEKPRMKHS